MPSADLRLPLTPDEIARRTWSFGVEGGERIYAPYLKLLRSGRIGGHLVDTERRWAVVDGHVVIYDGLDRRSTVFDTIRVDDTGRLALSGDFLLAPGSGTRHELREIETLGSLKPAGGMTSIRRAGPARRNLVVCGASAGSLHPRWPVDIPAADRNWDLWVNWYGAPDDFGHDKWAELQTRQHGRGKWPGMHHLCQVGSPAWDYEYVAFIDDDLMLNWSSLNELFALCRQFKLQLAQPALQPSEVPISHAITERNPDCLLRFTSFVETMCPVFSHDACWPARRLSACRRADSGWITCGPS